MEHHQKKVEVKCTPQPQPQPPSAQQPHHHGDQSCVVTLLSHLNTCNTTRINQHQHQQHGIYTLGQNYYVAKSRQNSKSFNVSFVWIQQCVLVWDGLWVWCGPDMASSKGWWQYYMFGNHSCWGGKRGEGLSRKIFILDKVAQPE